MNRNIEYGVELNNPESVQQICSTMNKYWEKAEKLTPQIVDEIRNRLALIESVVTTNPEPIIPVTSESKIHSRSTQIVNKRLKPQGKDIEAMKLNNLSLDFAPLLRKHQLRTFNGQISPVRRARSGACYCSPSTSPHQCFSDVIGYSSGRRAPYTTLLLSFVAVRSV